MASQDDDVRILYEKLKELDRKVNSLVKLEKRISTLESYCESIEESFQKIGDNLGIFGKIMSDFISLITHIFS